jgi:hypothetical protein
VAFAPSEPGPPSWLPLLYRASSCLEMIDFSQQSVLWMISKVKLDQGKPTNPFSPTWMHEILQKKCFCVDASGLLPRAAAVVARSPTDSLWHDGEGPQSLSVRMVNVPALQTFTCCYIISRRWQQAVSVVPCACEASLPEPRVTSHKQEVQLNRVILSVSLKLLPMSSLTAVIYFGNWHEPMMNHCFSRRVG